MRRDSGAERSEAELQAKLDDPGIAGGVDEPERRLINVAVGRVPLRVVEEVEELGAELGVEALGEFGVLQDAHVDVLDDGAGDGGAARGAIANGVLDGET